MEQVPEEKKDSMTKTLAILGFVAIVILIVWLVVKVVALVPSAFSSLASIADSVYSDKGSNELVVSTRNSVVNSGEAFTVSWSKMRGNGSYQFTFDCIDGVTLDLRRTNSVVEEVDCGAVVDLGDSTEADILINTKAERFTDVDYSITYERDGAEAIVTDSVITIVNASIPTGQTVAITEEDEDIEEPTEVTPPSSVTETPTESETPTTPVQTGPPVTTYSYTYVIPVSDPNGYVDLAVRHIATGIMDRGLFVPLPELEEDEDGAIRFEIINLGTKTAYDWDYEADLPAGPNYKSGDQKALKPNERVIVTLSFKGIDDDGIEKFGVEVDAKGDVNSANDEYQWSVKIND